MTTFIEPYNPTLESYWRSIILFGQNVASYKFALGKSLLELATQGKTAVTLEELAIPFSTHLIEHLKAVPKQSTSNSSRFLDTCRRFINSEISQDALINETVKLGFVNVIDAFHIVNQGEIPVRFYEDQRKTETHGIVLTDELFRLIQTVQRENFPNEVEARWQLVEKAWELNISKNLLVVQYDGVRQIFYTQDRSKRRVDITSSRNALNGYQKGKCFYCFGDISVINNQLTTADVDHFFPHTLNQYNFSMINGVWNLVLSCPTCNRGAEGKFARLPHQKYLERLSKRNEFFISSHHPLRETLIQQTGSTSEERASFLRERYLYATDILIHHWKAPFEHDAAY